jgi:hypothetical protein
MPRLSPEATKKQFPSGTVVRVNQTMLERWTTEAGVKMKNRIGEVMYFDEERNQLGVTFAAIGRRPAYKTRLYADETLQQVTDAAEIAAWRQEVHAKVKAQLAYARRTERAELATA